jgi:hypothetical protein
VRETGVGEFLDERAAEIFSAAVMGGPQSPDWPPLKS